MKQWLPSLLRIYRNYVNPYRKYVSLRKMRERRFSAKRKAFKPKLLTFFDIFIF